MFRRLMSSVVIFACAGVHTLAVERATFILTDGERKSGTIVSHGDQHENLINGYFNLGVDNGKDMTFPLDQVAVIDFVGGQPPATELAQLGTGHMLVTRTGAAQQGRLINMTGGDTLLWENLAKQRQQYAIRDVSRVYLNSQSARTAFGYTPPVTQAVNPPEPTQTARNSGNQGTQGNEGNQGNQGNRRKQGNQGNRGTQRGTTVRIDARQQWTDSGITVNRGDRLVFEASVPVRGLVGRIGDSPVFAIGIQQEPVVMRSSGPLLLGVSDEERRGERAAFSVLVSRP